jgi:hypothetical protein
MAFRLCISLNDEPHHLVLSFFHYLKGKKSGLKVALQKVKLTQFENKLNQLNYWYSQKKAFWLNKTPFWTPKSVQAEALKKRMKEPE